MKESGLIMSAKVLGSSTIIMVITTQVNGRRMMKVEIKSIMNLIFLIHSHRNKDKKEGKGQYFYSSNERYEGLFDLLKTFKLKEM